MKRFVILAVMALMAAWTFGATAEADAGCRGKRVRSIVRKTGCRARSVVRKTARVATAPVRVVRCRRCSAHAAKAPTQK